MRRSQVRSSDRTVRFSTPVTTTLAIWACVLVTGCVSTPASDAPRHATQPGGIERDQDAVETNDEIETVLLIEDRGGDYPELETHDTGFTITEQIRISGEIRGDYQNALQILSQQRYREGIALLAVITEEAPDVSAPHIDLGIAYRQSGDLERAEAALEVAAQLSPGHPIVHNELGIVYRQTGRFTAARASYERALETYPGFHYARRNLGILCDLYLADLICALEHYETYLESVNTDAEVELWIADIRNRLGQQEISNDS